MEHQKRCFPQTQWHAKNYLKNVLATSCWMLWRFKNSKKTNYVHFVSCQLGENILKDIFWQKWAFKSSKAWKIQKGKLCSFCKPPTWWKRTQRPLLTKLEAFKSSKVWKTQKGKLCLFCKPSAWWKRTQRHLLTKLNALTVWNLWISKSQKRQTLLIL